MESITISGLFEIVVNYLFCRTVNPVLSGHSKIDKTKVLRANDIEMKVESIAECTLWSILQNF